MKFRFLLIIGLLSLGYTSFSQTTDSILKLKKLLRGTWADSASPANYYTFNDTVIIVQFTIKNMDGYSHIGNVWHYAIKSECGGQKCLPRCYFIDAKIPANPDSSLVSVTKESGSPFHYCEKIVSVSKNRLRLYQEFSTLEQVLIRKE